MSQPHKIQIRNKAGAEDKITVGANTEILLDGKPLKGVRFIKFEVHARKMAKVMIELYAEVDIGATVELQEPKIKKDSESFKTQSGKTMAVHTISSFDPAEIIRKS